MNNGYATQNYVGSLKEEAIRFLVDLSKAYVFSTIGKASPTKPKEAAPKPAQRPLTSAEISEKYSGLTI